MACSIEQKFDYAGNDIYRFRYEIAIGATTYSDGDCIGGLITVPDVFGCAGYAFLINAMVAEKKGSGSLAFGNSYIYLFNKTFTIADGDAFTLTGKTLTPFDAEFIGQIKNFETVETDFVFSSSATDVANTITMNQFSAAPLKENGTTKDLYLLLQNNSGANMAFTTGAKLYVTLDFIRH